MPSNYGQHGWKEFHQNRKNILAEFDKILEQISNRPIQTAHGSGVEAYIRKWLSEFLPKKYGVTSGYVIPNLYDNSNTIYHFDIIIYNCLDAPVLWTEGNEDNSEQGKFRAIPAQHVVAIYEVKSRLTTKNIRNALEKLDQTRQFIDQLNHNYSCGIIFVDLKETENNSDSIIKELHKGCEVFGFRGGMVLRYEGDDSSTGLISIFNNTSSDSNSNNRLSPLAKHIDDIDIYQTEDGNVVMPPGNGAMLVHTSNNTWGFSKMYSVIYDEGGLSVVLSWSRSNFATFCVDLVSALEGLAYNDQKRPSFGTVFDSLRLERAPLQPLEVRPGYPFLTLSLFAGGKKGEKVIVSSEGGVYTIEFWISVSNEGDVEATISDDMFKTSGVLVKGTTGTKTCSFRWKPFRDGQRLEEILDTDGLEIPYRLVYKVTQNEEEFYALEKTVRILGMNISFL
jgi:hypothetical protein